MLSWRRCALIHSSSRYFSPRRHASEAHRTTSAEVDEAHTRPLTSSGGLTSSTSLHTQLASLSVDRQRVLGRDLQRFCLAALTSANTPRAPTAAPSSGRDATAYDETDPQYVDDTHERSTAANGARADLSISPKMSRVQAANTPRRLSEVQYTLARQFAAMGAASPAIGPMDAPAATGVESTRRDASERLQNVLSALDRAELGLSTAETVVWSALGAHSEVKSAYETGAHQATDDVRHHSPATEPKNRRTSATSAARELEQLLDIADEGLRTRSTTITAMAPTMPDMPPLQLCALVGWCADHVRSCAMAICVCASAMTAPHTQRRGERGRESEEDADGAGGASETVDATHPPAALRGYDAAVRATGERVPRLDAGEAQLAAMLFSAAQRVCSLLDTYLALIVDGLFVQGGFGEEEVVKSNEREAQGARSALTGLASARSRTSSSHVPSSLFAPLALSSRWSQQLRREARATCESVLTMLERLEAPLLPAWLAVASMTATDDAALMGSTISASCRQLAHDPQRVLHGLRLDCATVQRALCSQREHWPSALALTARMCSWNERLHRHAKTSSPEVAKDEDAARPRKAAAKGNTEADDPLTVAHALAPLLSHDTSLSMAYVLAQHGERALTEIFLDAAASHNMMAASPPDARGLAGLVRALAAVNSGPSHALVSPDPTSTMSKKRSASPLVRLVHNGMLPNRVLGVTEYAALLRLVDAFHRQDSLTTVGPASATRGEPKMNSPSRTSGAKKDWVLSPAQVWRHTLGYPHPLRTALCLLSFQVVVRHSLTDAMQLEDLLVVASLTRQMLRQQERARRSQRRQHARSDGQGRAVYEAQRDSVNENVKDDEGGTRDDDEALLDWCGALPPLLLPARRAAPPFTATHLVHLCETYLAIHQRHRKCVPLTPPHRGSAPSSFESSGPDQPRPGAEASASPSPSRVLMALVPRELIATLQQAHGAVTRQAVLTTCWEAALSAALALQFTQRSPLLARALPATNVRATTSASRIAHRGSISPPSALSERASGDEPDVADFFRILTKALAERVDVLDSVASAAYTDPLSSAASRASTTAPTSTIAPAACVARADLAAEAVPAILQLVPYLDPFTTARLVLGPVGRHASWSHCLSLLPYTPLGSASQLLLLRRVAQDRDGRRAASTHLADTLHWSKEAMLNVASAAARAAVPVSASLAVERQALSVLLETQWREALSVFSSVAPHAQITAAPHLVRLLVEADVWRDLSEAQLRPLVRLAIRATSSVANPSTSARARHAHDHSAALGDPSVSASATILGSTLVAHTLPTRTGAHADGPATLTEEVLHTALSRGLWLTGLQFHQMVTEEDPAMVQHNPRAQQYASLLSRGLLERSALTRAVALLLRATRRGQWDVAVQHFLEYATRDGHPQTHTRNTDAMETAHNPTTTTAEPVTSRSWPFRTALPPELVHVAQAVRYAFLKSRSSWRVALQWFPVVPSMPLPYSHEALVKARFGQLPQVASHGPATATDTTVRLLQNLDTAAAATTTTASPSPPRTAQPLPSALSTTPSTSLVAAARAATRVSRPAEDTRATYKNVHDALVLLYQHGEWESAVLVYERALAAGVFPYQDTAIALAATLDGGAPWEVTLHYFEHMTQHMRPDVTTAAVALQACAIGQQWEMAFRVLRQCVLTQSRPAPFLVESAIQTALHCGIWSRALQAAHTYRRTRNARLAHTVLSTYVAAKQWDEAVQYFYECAVRGLRPLDASIELALAASEAVSEEYRTTAMMVGAIASALEDVYHVSGVVMEHVMLVHRHWHRAHTQQATAADRPGLADEPLQPQHDQQWVPLQLEASSTLRVAYTAPSTDTSPHSPQYVYKSANESRAPERQERVYPLRFY